MYAPKPYLNPPVLLESSPWLEADQTRDCFSLSSSHMRCFYHQFLLTNFTILKLSCKLIRM